MTKTTNNLVITIMAAGEGKRMNSDIPKVLHVFKGKPMLIHIIETAQTLNPQRIIVITSPKNGDQIIDVIDQYISLLGLEHRNNIITVKQLEPLGTGDAIKSCLPYYTDSDAVLILNGDMPMISQNILDEFLNTNITKGGILGAQFKTPHGYGRLIASSDIAPILWKIVEEKDCTDLERQIQIVNAGIYLFSGFILKNYIPKIENKNVQKEYYLTDIVEIINSDIGIGQIRVHLIDESLNKYIRGVNTKEELVDLEKIA